MSSVTNVTYLPWVTPEDELAVDSSPLGRGEETSAKKSTSSTSAIRRVSFADVDVPSPTEEMLELEQTVLKKLSKQDMSIAEVSNWLMAQGAPERDAHELVEKFIRLNYLDDVRLAATLVTRLGERKGRSKSVVARELRQRGIPADMVDEAVSVIVDEDELAKATELACARVRQFGHLDDATAQRRLLGFLSRRGYSGDIIRQACATALSSRA